MEEWAAAANEEAGDEVGTGASPQVEGADDDGLPFACLICKRRWEVVEDPIVTRCRHYFCEQCALQHNARDPKCAACGQATQGIFNVALDIKKKLKRLKQAA